MTMKEVYIPKTKHEKAMQRALLQFRNPKYYTLVYEALTEAGRTDLIGNGPKCLIRDKNHGGANRYGENQVQGGNNKNNSYKGTGNATEKIRNKTGKSNDKNSYAQGKFKDKSEGKSKGKNENRNADKTQINRGKSIAMGKGKSNARNKSKRK